MQFDAATETHLALVYPGFAELLRGAMQAFYEWSGQQMKITEALRSFTRQAALFTEGRTAPGKIVTDALPGFSGHHYGTDADLAFTGADPYLDHASDGAARWRAWGACAQAHGLTWGGAFPRPDQPHVEQRFGLSVDTLRAAFLAGGISAVWVRLDAMRNVPAGQGWKTRNLFDPNK